ncbi:hypothetical protein [Macromonas bipunctata]|uniref:hypothetical protein n=1 Tax=Macromonas bipunctata TaxID=183670 RepID=UPI001475E823|nr:hypothetical protein [Macromonas bipunctata]
MTREETFDGQLTLYRHAPASLYSFANRKNCSKTGLGAKFFSDMQNSVRGSRVGTNRMAHTAGAMSLLWTALWADNGVAHTQEFACHTTPLKPPTLPPSSVPLG